MNRVIAHCVWISFWGRLSWRAFLWGFSAVPDVCITWHLAIMAVVPVRCSRREDDLQRSILWFSSFLLALTGVITWCRLRPLPSHSLPNSFLIIVSTVLDKTSPVRALLSCRSFYMNRGLQNYKETFTEEWLYFWEIHFWLLHCFKWPVFYYPRTSVFKILLLGRISNKYQSSLILHHDLFGINELLVSHVWN